MERVYNFSAGPSMMPLSALETAAKEMTNYRGRGMSVMEMSHRSKMYLEIYEEAVALVHHRAQRIAAPQVPIRDQLKA